MLRSSFLDDLNHGEMNPEMFERALSELSDETEVPVSRLREMYENESEQLAKDLVKICNPYDSESIKYKTLAGTILAAGFRTATPLATVAFLLAGVTAITAAGMFTGVGLSYLGFAAYGLVCGSYQVRKLREAIDLVKSAWNTETSESARERIINTANMKPDLAAAAASFSGLNAQRKIIKGLIAQTQSCTGDLARNASDACTALRTLADAPATGEDDVDRNITDLFNRAHQTLIMLAENNAKTLWEMDRPTVKSLNEIFRRMTEEACSQIKRIQQNKVGQERVSAPTPEPAAT